MSLKPVRLLLTWPLPRPRALGLPCRPGPWPQLPGSLVAAARKPHFHPASLGVTPKACLCMWGYFNAFPPSKNQSFFLKSE